MKEIFESQLFSLVLGAVLTMVTSVVIGKRSYVDSLNEKIAEERISAYKKIYKTIAKLNDSLSPKEEKDFPDECYMPYKNDGANEYTLSFCFPTVFVNFDTFHNYKGELSFVLNENRIYLNQSVLNKLFFLDQYLGEIWHITNGKNDDYLQMIGFLFGNEINKLRDSIEKDIQEFFFTGKIKMSKSNFKDPYKFAEKYIKETELYTLRKDLKNGKGYGNFPLCNNCSHIGKCPLSENEQCDFY